MMAIMMGLLPAALIRQDVLKELAVRARLISSFIIVSPMNQALLDFGNTEVPKLLEEWDRGGARGLSM